MNIEEAQAKLLDLISKLAPGDEVIITQNEQPVARLTSIAHRTLGTLKGTVQYMAPDFNAPLEDFKEYS
jgi:prevent-host-death family protein